MEIYIHLRKYLEEQKSFQQIIRKTKETQK